MKRPWTIMLGLLLLVGTACASAAPSPNETAQPTVRPPRPVATPEPTPTEQPVPALRRQAMGIAGEIFRDGNRGGLGTELVPSKQVNIGILLDASGSMLEQAGGQTKIDSARNALTGLIEKLPDTTNVSFSVFGHRYEDQARSCTDVEQLVPLGKLDRSLLVEQIQSVQATGWTPLGNGLKIAAEGFPTGPDNVNNLIVVSDGEETCGADPAGIARSLKLGEQNLTIHAIGFAVDEPTRRQLQRIAELTGGTYGDAGDAASLVAAIDHAVETAKGGTLLRAEVIGPDGESPELPVQVRLSGKDELYQQFVTPAESPIKPGAYDLIVGTAPRLRFRDIVIDAHTSTTIRIRTGSINVTFADPSGKAVRAPIELIDPATGIIVRSFFTGETQPVLDGTYDVRVLTTPVAVRHNVRIETGKHVSLDLGSGRVSVLAVGPDGRAAPFPAELWEDGASEPSYRFFSGGQSDVVAGTYRVVLRSDPPQELGSVSLEPGQSRALRYDFGTVRVEARDLNRRIVRVPIEVFKPGSDTPIARAETWDTPFLAPGTYDVVIHGAHELRQTVQVLAGQQVAIPVTISPAD